MKTDHSSGFFRKGQVGTIRKKKKSRSLQSSEEKAGEIGPGQIQMPRRLTKSERKKLFQQAFLVDCLLGIGEFF